MVKTCFIVMLLCASVNAKAGLITQTFTDSSPRWDSHDFDPFDASLGTLESVTLYSTLTFSIDPTTVDCSPNCRLDYGMDITLAPGAFELYRNYGTDGFDYLDGTEIVTRGFGPSFSFFSDLNDLSPFSDSVNPISWRFDYFGPGDTPNLDIDARLEYHFSAVPVPSTLLLLLGSLLLIRNPIKHKLCVGYSDIRSA